ncbi:MAG: FAD-binding protein [Anaerolineae bacterium]
MLDSASWIETDILVVGTGAAGCRAAIEACEYAADVVLVAKGTPGRVGSTNLAGVHYAAALGHTDPRDNPWHHFEDTVIEARWIGDQELIKIMCLNSPKTVYDLERYGLRWYRMAEDDTRYYQLPTPGHSFDRGVHFNLRTGKMVQDKLMDEVGRHADITVLPDTFITSVLIENGIVVGATGIDLQTGELLVISAKAVVLATGGAGMMYKVTDMETGSTGDGIAMAYRAGADLIAPEMHQFFPTAFVWPESLRGVAVNSSQLWKLGLRLYNANDERFMECYYPEWKENMPRDILTQCIFREIQEGRGTEHGGVWLDTRWIEGWEKLRKEKARSYIFPAKFGINTERFEIAPTYHFTLGGVRINSESETCINGLFACGEIVGATHGANRLGGNALAECMVFGEIAGRNAAIRALDHRRQESVRESLVKKEQGRLRTILQSQGESGRRPGEIFEELRHVMYHNVGIVRDEKRLEHAIDEIGRLREDARTMHLSDIEQFNNEWVWALELDCMLELADIFARGALMRTESRGAHYRSDYPETDDENWLKNIFVKRENGGPVFWTEPVKLLYLKEVEARYEAAV